MNNANAITHYRLRDIAENDGVKSDRIWVVVKNCVLDVTEFKKTHPGGEEALTEWAGRDATSAFLDVGHSADADDILRTLVIGEVALQDREVKPTKDADTGRPKRSFWALLTGKK